MPLGRTIRDVTIGCVLWAALALASLAAREGLGAMLLLWAPAGVLVATLLVVPLRHWLWACAALLPVQAGCVMTVGVPATTALGYSAAALVQGLVCAALSMKVLGHRDRAPRTFTQIAGLLGALFLGCLFGALATWPFRPAAGLLDAATWLMGNVLGILTVAPQLMRFRLAWLNRTQTSGFPFNARYALCLAGCGVLAAIELNFGYGLASPLLIVAMVGMTVRFGQSAVGSTILVYFAVACALGPQVLMRLQHLSALQAMLILQTGMLLMFGTALPITAMLLKRDQMQRELVRRNAALRDNLMLLDLGEELAGIGRWRLDFVTGRQDWSPRMLELVGLPPDLGSDPGHMWHVMSDHGTQLRTQIEDNRDARQPFQFDLTIKPGDGPERILRASMVNEFDADGRRLALFGVAMDVTRQVRREQALELAKARAVRLAAEAQALANTDPLTGLPNRRCTFARLDSMVDVAKLHGGELTAVMFDIDHFKRINDTFGHQTGDEVIVQIAELARRQARQSDVVGRIGGEEFVWLLPGINSAGARALAERLRRAVEAGIDGSALPQVTVSVGLAQYARGDDAQDLLARADAGLYEAKEQGRNQVRRAA